MGAFGGGQAASRWARRAYCTIHYSGNDGTPASPPALSRPIPTRSPDLAIFPLTLPPTLHPPFTPAPLGRRPSLHPVEGAGPFLDPK